MTNRSMAVSVVLMTGFLLMTPATGQVVGSFQLLEGSWRGWGWITLTGGAQERIRCKVDYQIDGDLLSQDIRCTSTSYKIHATSRLRARGKQITGKWQETGFDVSGDVTGQTNASGFSLRLAGGTFSAGMAVDVQDCRQTVDISITGIDVKKISIGMRKC